MLCLFFIAMPFYLGLVWVLSRLLCRDPGHRKSHVEVAAVGLVLAFLVVSLGVPYADSPKDRVGLSVALGLLVLAPIVVPRLGVRAQLCLGAAAIAAFAEPWIRAEYLTVRHGPTLRHALAQEHGADDERLFSVLSYSQGRAKVLHVARNGEGSLLRFQTDANGSWHVEPGSYPPQQLLWYHGNSGDYNCPYPTSVLLLVHSVGEWCG